LSREKIIEMEPGFQRRVQRYGWDKASAHYETFWHRQLKPAQDLLLEMANLHPGENVLDVACGTGLVSFQALTKLGDDGRVIGTDISEKMIEKACMLAEQKKEYRVKFERMDAEDLKLNDGSFDVVLCALGLMYMPNPLNALKEIYRVLKPGGRTVALVWGQRDRCGWSDLFEIVDQHVTSEVCPMFFNLGNSNILELSFKAAGFNATHIKRITTFLSYGNSREALGAAFEGGPVALAYNKFNEDVKKTVHAAYLSSIAPFKKGEGYQVPGEFVLAIGFR
jgi:ubiquinone/menaquinone biosynthesis C-methylase UbiE